MPALSAQRPLLTVQIHVADSAGVAIAGADVAIVHGTTDVVAHGSTNADGRVALTIPRTSNEQQIVVRKVGYERGYRFFSVAEADSARFEIRLLRTSTTLAPVVVTAEEDRQRKSYHLTADEIENSTRTLFDAADIFKIRPDMMTSRGGAQACEVFWTPRDGWIETVWVNGTRVQAAFVDSIYVMSQRARLGLSTLPARPQLSLTPSKKPRPLPPTFWNPRHIDSVLSILHTIKPEHIAEVTYHDCFDASVGKNHSDMAMFIVLKPGIAFATGIGSYVVGDSAIVARMAKLATASSATSALDVGDLPRYRFRLLGVFDGETGNPLPDVDVIDSTTGNRAKTSPTGTVSLYFVPEGAATLRLRRDGYRDTTVALAISPADTMPLTLVMSRRP